MVKERGREALPEGWTTELRSRRNGRTYACYICPVTKLKFYSKQEVFRYLQNPRNRYSGRNKSTTNPLKSEVKSVISKGVPSRWSKELGARNENHKSKIDKFPEMNRTQKVPRCQGDGTQDIDWSSKLCTRGELDTVSDCKAKKKYTKETARRTTTLPEKDLLDKRTNVACFPGNDTVFALGGMEVQESVNENRAERGNDGPNPLTGAGVDQFIEKEMNEKAHAGSVNKLSNRNVDDSSSLKGVGSSAVHVKEQQIRNVLKQLQGPILLPAGYISHFQGALRPVSHHEENGAKQPFHCVSTDPCTVDTRSPLNAISTQGDQAEASGRSQLSTS